MQAEVKLPNIFLTDTKEPYLAKTKHDTVVLVFANGFTAGVCSETGEIDGNLTHLSGIEIEKLTPLPVGTTITLTQT